MPAVIIPIAFTAAATFAISGTTAAIIVTGLSLASVLISYTLTPSPPKRKGITSNRIVNVHGGTEPRRLLYGRTRSGGLIAFATTSERRNNHLHIALALGEGPIDAIENVYFNDLPRNHVSLSSFVHLTSYLGTINQTADPDLMAASAQWNTYHRGRGIAWLYVRLTWDARGNAWPSGVPTISSIVRGRRLWDPRTSPIVIESAVGNTVSTTTPHRLRSNDQLWITNISAWGWHEVTSILSESELILDNQYGQNVTPKQGRIFKLVWSNNAALCILDYLLYLRRGMPWEILTTILDLESFRIAAAICDESVTLNRGKTQSRYTINGEVSLDSRPVDVLEEMLKACAGHLAVIGGQISLYVGASSTPTHTITEDDIIDSVVVLPRPARKSLFNTLHGTFRDDTDLWREKDLPPTTNVLWRQQDGNESLSRDVSFDFVTDVQRGQRLHRLILNEARQATRVEVVGGLGLMSIAVWDVIRLSIGSLGYVEKLFRVHDWRLEADGRIRLGLQEYAAAIYTWDATSDQAVDPAPDTLLPSPGTIKPPLTLLLMSGDASLLLQADGVVVSRIQVSWQAAEDVFIAHYELQWRRVGEVSWESRFLSRDEVMTYVSDVQDGARYQVRLRAIGFSGALSSWVEAGEHRVLGKRLPPPAPILFRVSVQSDGTRVFEWTMQSVPVDVRVGGGWQVRYSIQDGRGWDQMLPLHQGLWISSPMEINRPGAGAWRFAIRTVDSSGNVSPVVFAAESQLPHQRLKDLIFYRREGDETWPGSFSNAYVGEEGVVWSSGRWMNVGSSWSAMTDRWVDVDRATTWSYTTPLIDLGADIEVVLLWQSVPFGLTVEMRLGKTVDQGVTTSWQTVPRGIVQVRYVMFRISGGGTLDHLTLFEILGDAELLNQQWNDVDISGTDQLWFKRISSGVFRIAGTRLSLLTQAQITAIHGTEGRWTWSLVSKSLTLNEYPAAEFRVYNALGQPGDAVVDIQLRGPQAPLM